MKKKSEELFRNINRGENQQPSPSSPPLKKVRRGGRKISFSRRTGKEGYHHKSSSSGKSNKTKETCLQHALYTTTG